MIEPYPFASAAQVEDESAVRAALHLEVTARAPQHVAMTACLTSFRIALEPCAAAVTRWSYRFALLWNSLP